MAETRIGGGRKAAYYVGTFMMAAGFVLAFASFLPSFSLFGAVGELTKGTMATAGRGRAPDPSAVTGFLDTVGSQVFLTFVMVFAGVGLIIAGSFVRRAGSHGLAGSGLVLDPSRARQDVRPWSEMQGGVIRDTLDAAGIQLGGAVPPAAAAGRPTGDLAFDEKLRRLHKLRQEGLISEDEYQRERKEILDAT
jgi:hypothetical protein